MPDSAVPGRWPRPEAKRRRALVAGVLGILLGGVLASCSGSDDGPDGGSDGAAGGTSSSAAPSGSTPSASGSPTSGSSPSGSGSASGSGGSEEPGASTSPARIQDPQVGTYKPVKRPGGGSRSVSASPQPFDSSVRYGDGLRLVVTDVTQSKSASTGPGSFPGQPVTRVGLRMTNGSKDRLDVDRVVVTALYGSPRRQARPVYDARSRDFSGTVRPGGTTSAVYSFSIPTARLGSVRMIVDFDGVHTVATFTGDPRTAD